MRLAGSWNSRTKRLAAYLLLAITGVVGLGIVEHIATVANDGAKKAQSAVERLDAQVAQQCISGNQGRLQIRQTLTDIINIAVTPQPPVPGQPPLTEDQQRERQARLDRFLKNFEGVLVSRLPLRDCDGDGDVDGEDGGS